MNIVITASGGSDEVSAGPTGSQEVRTGTN